MSGLRRLNTDTRRARSWNQPPANHASDAKIFQQEHAEDTEEDATEDHLDRERIGQSYERADFDDAFRRYLPPARPTPDVSVRAGLCESVKQPSAKNANATNGTAANEEKIQAQFAMLMEKLLAAASKQDAKEKAGYDI